MIRSVEQTRRMPPEPPTATLSPRTRRHAVPRLRSVVDRLMQAWEEAAFPLARRLAREEGLFVGMSSGAIAWAAMEVARELGPDRRVLCIAPDSGARYLTTALFTTP